jgi:predicted Fe-S protein YdhL (DUF1289 family)
VSPPPAIVTPCILVCFIDPESGLCLGCFRTGDEIANWIAMAPERRVEVMAELPGRRALIDPEKLG